MKLVWWELALACLGMIFGVWATVPQMRGRKFRPLFRLGVGVSALSLLLIFLAQGLKNQLLHCAWLLIPYGGGWA